MHPHQLALLRQVSTTRVSSRLVLATNGVAFYGVIAHGVRKSERLTKRGALLRASASPLCCTSGGSADRIEAFRGTRARAAVSRAARGLIERLPGSMGWLYLVAH